MLNPFGEGLKTNADKTEKKEGLSFRNLTLFPVVTTVVMIVGGQLICFAVAVGPSLATETTFM